MYLPIVLNSCPMKLSGVQFARPILPPGLQTHARAGAQIERFAQVLTDDLQSGAHDGIVACGPGGLLAVLHRGEIDVRRVKRGIGNDFGHGSNPSNVDGACYGRVCDIKRARTRVRSAAPVTSAATDVISLRS